MRAVRSVFVGRRRYLRPYIGPLEALWWAEAWTDFRSATGGTIWSFRREPSPACWLSGGTRNRELDTFPAPCRSRLIAGRVTMRIVTWVTAPPLPGHRVRERDVRSTSARRRYRL